MQNAEIANLNKLNTVPIAKGDVLIYDAADDNFKTAPINGTSTRYAVAVKAAATTDTRVEAAISGYVYVTADGTIARGDAVKVSGVTPGQVVAADAVVAVSDVSEIVGHYAGKMNNNEREGTGTIPNAADGDIIIIRLAGLSQ